LGLAVALARRELGCLAQGMDRLWAVGHMPIGYRYGPGLLLGVVAFQQPGGTAPQRAAFLRRLAAFPAYLDALAANAREGLASGVVAARAVVARTIGQIERLLATPVADSPALAPLAADGGERSLLPPAWPRSVIFRSGSNGSSLAHCSFVRSPRPMRRASHGTLRLLKHALVRKPALGRLGVTTIACLWKV